VVAGTSNPGKVFALSSGRRATGPYESDVRDAGTVGAWGAIRWRATGRPGEVEISTRSGNTATPDQTWSPWSRAYATASGDKITSPNARYLQWRAVLKSGSPGSTGSSGSSGSPGSRGSSGSTGSLGSTGSSSAAPGAGPVLTSVTARYLPRNLRPVVESITVHPPGTVFQRPFSTGELEIAGFEENTSDGRSPQQQGQGGAAPGSSSPAPALGRKIYQKGLQTFVWKADD